MPVVELPNSHRTLLLAIESSVPVVAIDTGSVTSRA